MKFINKTTTEFGTEVIKYDVGNCVPKDNVVELISSIASVCYASEPKNKNKLYDMLMKENSGALPSSAFSFQPVLLTPMEMNILMGSICNTVRVEAYPAGNTCPKLMQYGYFDNVVGMWVCNFRSLVYDYRAGLIDEATYEGIINRPVNMPIFIYKVNGMSMYTFGQHVRHSQKLQVISRRYVKDSKVPFTFTNHPSIQKDSRLIHMYEFITDTAREMYKEAINDFKVKPEIARGLIPQCANTSFWFGWNTPVDESNYIDMRTKKSAQDEIRAFADVLKEL